MKQYRSSAAKPGNGPAGSDPSRANGIAKQTASQQNKGSVTEEGKVWAAALPKAEQRAITEYSGTGYIDVNGALRGFMDFSDASRNRAVLIHSALSRSRIPCACTVYRGASFDALGQWAGVPDEDMIGAVIEDDAFVSTSLRYEDAFSKQVLFEIDVPEGAHGAYIGYLSALGHNESEVLFDAGMRMRVTGVHRNADGRRVVRAQMLV